MELRRADAALAVSERARARTLLDLLGEARADVARCDVGHVGVDAVTVDALARLQLAARRYGCQVRLRNASAELLELVDLMGLSDVLSD
jgi:ABC-type transporter Mla MlaB component